MNWIELHTNSRYSEELSMIEPHQLISMCANTGCHTVAITDRNSVFSYLGAEQEAKSKQVRLLYGLTVDCLDRNDRYAVTLLAENQQGREQIFSLIRLMDQRNSTLGHYVTREELENHRAGLLFGASAVDGQLTRAIELRKSDGYLLRIAGNYDYIELPLEPYDVSAKLLQIAEKSGVTLCAVQNGVLPTGSDELDRHAYRAIARSKGLREEAEQLLPGRVVAEDFEELYVLPNEAEHMLEALKNGPEALVSRIQPMPTLSQWLAEGNEELQKKALAKLKELVREGWGKFCKTGRDFAAEDRVRWELHQVEKSGAAQSFLLLHEIQTAFPQGCRMQLMGTWNSSFLLYLLGILELNPLDGPGRVPTLFFVKDQLHCPEIRIPPQVRKAVIEMLNRLYGSHLLLLRPCMRLRETDQATQEIMEGYLRTADQELRAQLAGNELFENRIAYGRGRIVPSALSKFVIVPQEEKRDLLPLTQAENGMMEWRAAEMEIPGLTSLMMLDSAMLDVLTECQQITGAAYEEILLDEEEVLSAIHEQSVPGVAEACRLAGYTFSENQRSIRDLMPENSFRDLCRAICLSHGTGVWRDNQEDLLRTGKITPEQVICCREDVYQYLTDRGISEEKAAEFMKAVYMGRIKKQGYTEEQEEMLQSCGAEPWFVEACSKIDYLFPECHATGQILLLVRLVWYLLNFPEQVEPFILEEAKQYGI